MKKVLLAGLAVGALALGAPSAYATDYHIEGGCSFASATDAVAGQGQQTGEIDIQAVVHADAPENNPTHAKITCYITVNGSPQAGATCTAEGDVVVVGACVITYTSASVTDNVQLCQTVEYSNPNNGHTQTTSQCFPATTFEIPPPIIWEIVDPIVCNNVLIPLEGEYTLPDGTVVVINEQGDVYIDGEPQFDCPPYDIVWP